MTLVPRTWLPLVKFERLWQAGTQSDVALVQGASWCSRRVETVEIEGLDTVRRSFSFHIDPISPHDLGPRSINDHRYIPLMWLDKRPVATRLDARDASGRCIPILTREENAVMTIAAVFALIQRVADRQTATDCLPLVVELVRADAEHAKLALDELVVHPRLRSRSDVTRVFWRAAANSAIWHGVPRDERFPTVVKVAYDWPLEKGLRPLWERVLFSLGLRLVRVFLHTSLSDAQSTQTQVQLPTVTKVRRVRVLTREEDRSALRGGVSPSLYESAARITAHDVRPTHPVVLEVGFAIHRRVLLTTATVLSTLMAAAQTAAWLTGTLWSADKASVVACFLAIPAVVAVVAAPRQETALETSVLAGTRALLFGAAANAVVAALLIGLSGPAPPATIATLWSASLVAAWAAAIVQATAWIFSLRRRWQRAATFAVAAGATLSSALLAESSRLPIALHKDPLASRWTTFGEFGLGFAAIAILGMLVTLSRPDDTTDAVATGPLAEIAKA